MPDAAMPDAAMSQIEEDGEENQKIFPVLMAAPRDCVIQHWYSLLS